MDWKRYLPIIVAIGAVILFFVMSKGSSSSIQTRPQVEPLPTSGSDGLEDLAFQERLEKQRIAAGLFSDLLGYQLANKQLDLRFQLSKEGKSFQ